MMLRHALVALALAAPFSVSDRHIVAPVMRTWAYEQSALACERTHISWGNRGLMALEGRASPYDSLTLSVGGAAAKVCYGRPSARNRQVYGGLVPYDTLWRTGANEPTTIHLSSSAEIAGLAVPAGSYTLYSVPGRDTWSIIVNGSTSQWGLESDYTPEVRAQEIGRATVPAQRTPTFVETFTISARPAGGGSTELLLEWENTRVAVPIVRTVSP